ncbi:MAG: ribonuclease H family protein [Tannerellaceae bacterium]|jgi:ribonuclease HI|nr:ribonuclease H family protein [Tannerellaceae bacterium]
MAKRKFYVVWKGLAPGIYDDWNTCKRQVYGQADAKYKSFDTREEAEKAFEKGYRYSPKKASSPQWGKVASAGKPVPESLSVDAACSGNPGAMEYRGVYTATGKELFHVGPLKQGTNNVGEFLALVHGLALLKKENSDLPIYSDSRNAMLWVKNRKCKTLLARTPENEPIFNLIERAEKWLKENSYSTQVYKWETGEWGEIPADFGRK